MSLAPEIKIAQQRQSVLELAKALGNVSAACKQCGVSRTQFYEYKRRFQTHGIEDLMDLPYCGVEVMLVLVKCGLFSFKFLDCPLAVSEHAGNVQPSGIVWGLVGADF